MTAQNKPQLPAELEKRLSEFYISYKIVCSKCKHSKESHWWNGGGREESSGYDACHSCDCDCMGDEVVNEYIENHEYMSAFLATALEEQRQMIYSLPPISLYRKLKSENDAIVLGILAECKKHNAKPTLEQIRETMGAKSLTTVQRSLARLEKIGLVKRDKYKKRSWEALLTQKEDR